MIQQVKVLAIESGDLSSVPRTLMVERTDSPKLSSGLHMHNTSMFMHVHKQNKWM